MDTALQTASGNQSEAAGTDVSILVYAFIENLRVAASKSKAYLPSLPLHTYQL
jgi:hypothetical protein